MRVLKLITLKSTLKILILASLPFSCAEAFFTDLSLPKVASVKSVVDRSGIGFEWSSLAKFQNVQGVNIYRAVAKKGVNQTYIKIDSVGTRYATHYVDTTVKPGVNYFYTFTTFAGLSESAHGDIVAIKSKAPYKAVKFVSAKLVDRGVVKLLWVPNSEPTVSGYIIQRKCSRDNKWHYLDKVKGRLYPEYIDTRAERGFTCDYRVFASDALGLTSYNGKEIKVEVK
jgi:fibronectin type 3 domain-containing protein